MVLCYVFPPDRRFPVVTRAFTLLEVIISILIVAIVATMLLPVIGAFQARAERVKCTANLRNLHVAANLYVQEHRMWPQVAISARMDPGTVAGLWIDAFQPYGLTQINWICPTIQRTLQSPDLSNPENARIDYAATNFDSKQQSPFLYSTQPWFIESGNMHGDGNLIIFPDGHVSTLNELLAGQKH